jgi:tetratricopeptide (TPR) repeat protein/transglutaminase-like putative cysteine protease
MKPIFAGTRLAVSLLLSAWQGAHAADKLVFAPAPSWVSPAALPQDTGAPTQAAVRYLLTDMQYRFVSGADEAYVASAARIQTPQGLQSMGTVSLAWNPDIDTVTVHRLHILRGAQVIDVLGSGASFTVLRREKGLEGAALDGVLTATIQPPGLQIGDILDFAYTLRRADPVFGGRAEWTAILPFVQPVRHVRLRAQWPKTSPIAWRASPQLPGIQSQNSGDTSAIALDMDDVQPLLQVKGAPARYAQLRRVDFSEFPSWQSMSAHFAPLYAKAAALKPHSPLQAEIDRIRAANASPAARAGAALALVQDNVRYFFLGMNDGGLVPADAELTWQRRFGDCKGKTVLLLALLHGLDIDAVPALVNAFGGDGIDARLPVMGVFNHVLVRVRLDGRTYWLDGTRTGDHAIADIAVPAFHWGLPLVPEGSALVPITPLPLTQPSAREAIRIDASAGVYAPAPFHAELTLKGDPATRLRLQIANATSQAIEQGLRSFWSAKFDFVDIKSAEAHFDEAAGEEKISMDGSATLDRNGATIKTNGLGLGRRADFDRAPGPDQDAPFAVAFPVYSLNTETIKLPDGGRGFTVKGDDLDLTVAGMQYTRTAKIEDGSFSGQASARSLAPEFPASEAPNAKRALRDLLKNTVSLRMPPRYRVTDADIAAELARTPATADDYLTRGNLLLDHGDYDRARADLDHAVTLDPHSARALADRGIASAHQGDDVAARRDFDAAAAIDPRNAVVFRGRGLLALRAGHAAEAIAAFTTALEIKPDNGFALQRRASAYVLAGDDDHALADTDSMLRLQPEVLGTYVIRAGIFLRRGRADDAAAEARAALAAGNGGVDACLTAGAIYASLHRTDDAMRVFDQALKAKPAARIFVARARARPESDLAGRKADLDEALKLEPHDSAALIARADAQTRAGDYAGAIATLADASVRGAHQAELLTWRGVDYWRSKQDALAEKDFSAAASAAKTAEDRNTLCWIKAMAGVALASALVDCQAALAAKPDTAAYLDSEGFTLLRLGRLDDAIAAYTRALSFRAASAPSLFGRGVAELRRGGVKQGDADVAAARHQDGDIVEEFARYGVVP